MTDKITDIEAIIFDYGGVICTTRRSKQLAGWLVSEYGVDSEVINQAFETEELHLYGIGKATQDDAYSFFERLGLPISTKEIVEKFCEFGKPSPGMKSLVYGLKSKGYDLAMISNSIPELTSVVRDEFPGVFSVEIFSEEVHLLKPYPAIFDLALREIKTPATNCLFIDDQKVNLGYPNSIGIHTYLFESEEKLRQELKEKYGLRF